MPIPIIGLAAAVTSVLNARNFYIVAGAYVAFKDQINAVVYQVLEGDGAAGWVTGKVNEKLSDAGVPLLFGNVFDIPRVKSDVDRFLAQRINAKAGTNFSTIQGLTRDDFLGEVGRSIAGKVNSETGANIASVWPVAVLRKELGTELSRQFDPGVDLGSGALFKRDILEKIERRVYAKFVEKNPSPVGNFWPPPNNEKEAARRSKGRARQQKYRKSHKLVWVDK